MSERNWFYAKDNKSVGPIPEGKMQEMFDAGDLRPETLIWSEPMSEWTPASTIETFRFNTTHPPAPAKSDTNEIENKNTFARYNYTKDPSSLTKFLKIILWISLGINIILLVSVYMQMNLLSGPFSQAEAISNDIRQRIIGVLSLIAFIVTGIAFLRWIYRANSNCHGFGAQDMKFTPGWSIGYYFIPFWSWFRPYQSMKEIWKVSTDPVDWQNKTGGSLLRWWWGLYLLSGIFGLSAFRMSLSANTVSSLQAYTDVSITSGIIDIPLYIVALSLVSAIFTKQEKLVRRNV